MKLTPRRRARFLVVPAETFPRCGAPPSRTLAVLLESAGR